MKINIEESKTWTTLLVAERKIDFPTIDQNEYVIIPEQDRRQLEFAIETIANIISVFGRCKRFISSATPCVALVTEVGEELQKLNNSKGILGKRMSITSASGVNELDSDLLSQLQDRFPAVALIAEAHSHSLAAGKFHEYVRLFEYAFAMQFSQLQKKLLQFLNPVYGYTSDEIKSWTQIRDPLTHADGKKSNEIYLDSDARKVVQRMEQAAYDVLFNKKIWHDKSRERRDVWSPIAATTNNAHDLIIKQGSEPSILFQVLDEFGVFPMNLNAILNPVPSEWWCKMSDQDAN
ncbi:MAG: hypothetical protein ABW080_00445 [Candidatus Thiodiazotropha sp.]